MDKANLEALLERVEAATGANFKLEEDIANALLEHYAYPPPAYTASIDAALALVERVLPGWQWEIHSWPEHTEQPFVLMGAPGNQTADLSGSGATPPIAILAALLKALIAQEATCAS